MIALFIIIAIFVILTIGLLERIQGSSNYRFYIKNKDKHLQMHVLPHRMYGKITGYNFLSGKIITQVYDWELDIKYMKEVDRENFYLN
jgi:hypothetical protein